MQSATLHNGYAPFGFYVPILKAGPGEADGEWIVEGPLSEPGTDLQGEAMDMGGLKKGLATFTRLGRVVDWEHLYERTRDPEAIIGKGIEIYDAPHPVSGKTVPWLKVRLLKGQRLAQKAWNLLQAGGSLGFSVAGAALRKAGSKILESMITTVAITAVPVQAKNAGTLQVAKALEGLDGYDGAVEDLFLPVVPELVADGVFPLFRALAATGALPPAGPGIDAAAVEGLGGGASRAGRKRRGLARPDDDEDEVEYENETPGLRRKRAAAGIRKALAAEIGRGMAGRGFIACAAVA